MNERKELSSDRESSRETGGLDLSESVTWVWFAVLFVFIGTSAGLASLGFNLIPLESLQGRASAAAADGTVDTFRTMMKNLRFRARVLAAVFSILALLTFHFRNNVRLYVRRLTMSVPEASRQLNSWVSRLRSNKVQILVLLSLVIVAIILRLRYLNLPVTTDEAQTFVHRTFKPFYVGLSLYDQPNNHLLNTLFTRLAYLAGGDSPWVLRLPSFVAGVLVIPACYFFFRAHYDGTVGLLAASLSAVSVPLVQYGSQSRGYSFLVLFSLIALLLCSRLVRRDEPVWWLLFAIVSGIGAYAVPLMLYPFCICLTWLIMERASVKGSIPWSSLITSIILTGIITLYLYLPVLLVSGPDSLLAGNSANRLELSGMLDGLVILGQGLWSWFHLDIPTSGAVILSILGLVALVRHSQISRDAVSVGLLSVMVVLSSLLAQRVIPPRRALLFLLPIYLGLVSAGVMVTLRRIGASKLPKRMEAYVAVLVALVGGINATKADTPRQQIQQAGITHPEAVTEFLKSRLKSEDDVMGRRRLWWPSRYYLMTAGLGNHLALGDPKGDTLYILTRVGEERESIEDIVEELSAYENPHLVEQIGNTQLFLLTRARPRK